MGSREARNDHDLQVRRKWKDSPTPTPTAHYLDVTKLSSSIASYPPNKNKLQLQSTQSHQCHTRHCTNNMDMVQLQPPVIVPVLYYLSRNAQLEHPHFIQVPLSSTRGLFLRDVIRRLNLLRGTAMPSHYSWSSKRCYKNGYVWHDLEENDFIHPVHGGEYVLKGSEILFQTTTSSPPLSKSSQTSTSSTTTNSRHRNQSWSAIDLHNAASQTDDKRRRHIKADIDEEDDENIKNHNNDAAVMTVKELSRDEISPPPSDSSPESLELMKADGKLVISVPSSSQSALDQNQRAENCPSGRMKASSVLMSLISCGSVSFRDFGTAAVNDHGFSIISHYKTSLPRGDHLMEHDEIMMGNSKRSDKLALADKEYFSGSLIETKKDQYRIPSLKRSSSYNADRNSHLKLAEKEEDLARAKCMPRKPKAQTSGTNKKESEEAQIMSKN